MLLELDACSNLVVDDTWTILLNTSIGPFRIEALVLCKDEWISNCSIETQVAASKLVNPCLWECIAQCNVLDFHK